MCQKATLVLLSCNLFKDCRSCSPKGDIFRLKLDKDKTEIEFKARTMFALQIDCEVQLRPKPTL